VVKTSSNTANATAPVALRYSIAGYSGSTRDLWFPPTGTVQWAGGVSLLEMTFAKGFPQGFYTVSFPDLNQSFGVVCLLDFATRHPEGRDAAFSIDAAMTEATGVGYRPDFDAFRGQLISSLGRFGRCGLVSSFCLALALASPFSRLRSHGGSNKIDVDVLVGKASHLATCAVAVPSRLRVLALPGSPMTLWDSIGNGDTPRGAAWRGRHRYQATWVAGITVAPFIATCAKAR
jgi:hypothetical protein